MINYNKINILNSWIMIEHLSEGDISLKDRTILRLNKTDDSQYYSILQETIKEKLKTRNKNSGIVFYFDIFKFNEVIKILRKKYHLPETDEEIRVGNKFSFALYFDKNLKLISEMTFFTASAYIKYNKEIPESKNFVEFEDHFKKYISEHFNFQEEDNTQEENTTKFNNAINKIMNNYRIDKNNCRIQVLRNIENDAINLHSFFIEDLEKAKNIDTENLDKYLKGVSGKKFNLDSKKESVNFNPKLFDEILRPKNYPLGRFPSKTEYSLALMQQVAVNLTCTYDNSSIRSVNGPPGTGKTTLLKDIFAELVVKQAYEICNLQNKKIEGNENTKYWENASIGILPDKIIDNNIIVASSNNGAVQNIVKELPLIKEIDDKFIEDLRQSDYFYDIANSKVSVEWKKDDNGKNTRKLVKESIEEKDKYWGLFSLEGGKQDNMTNIITNIEHIIKYFETYEEETEVYNNFISEYKKVKNKRDGIENDIKNLKEYKKIYKELEILLTSFEKNFHNKNSIFEEDNLKLDNKIKNYSQEIEIIKKDITKLEDKQKILEENKLEVENFINILKSTKPGLFARRETKREYKNKKNINIDELEKYKNEIIKNKESLRSLRSIIDELKSKIKEEENRKIRNGISLEEWCKHQDDKKIELLRKIDSYNIKELNELDMKAAYDKLHISNPWFDEEYRISQSKLFISALKVRKQFLYENVRNLKAAVSITEQSTKYLDRKELYKYAFQWINLSIPVIGSTFASFSRMCRNLESNSLGHLFIDEAGQALPQASIGSIFRSKNIMAVGDPSQIEPVLTLDSYILNLLGKIYQVGEKYISSEASTQTLVDSASQYGFYRDEEKKEESWIGIPLWVHRRCKYPMFTISNEISYDGMMVQGNVDYGKVGWYDVSGSANNKYVEEQGDFILMKIKNMAEKSPEILDKDEKDIVYVITPFSNVAYKLANKLKGIGFTRYDKNGKPINVGTIHTFQGKEAPIVFMVLGADNRSSGAAKWAVNKANMMNVAVTRAKSEFYIIGDKDLYLSLRSNVVDTTTKIIEKYESENPDLVDNDVERFFNKDIQISKADNSKLLEGMVNYVGVGKEGKYAYIKGDDGKEYTINEKMYKEMKLNLKIGETICFIPNEINDKLYAIYVRKK
ncbi:AAA domain-containing protein [Helcococcus kunzii]|uniref:AAA domain-containing protein n=2 Tax=Helcococcus kunzii TaxID=40091 RepID=UPI00389CB26D